ncbi:hypothetical protein SY88_12135 [Clostridiales bacterium PH28_bin88]|nr:hypothetical protein SY88_12135 [Clostridiales bacterium PH28_bin88]
MYIVHRYQQGRKWVARLPFEADLLEALEHFAGKEEIKVGRVEAIGAVKKAVIGFYDQDKKEYGSLEFEEPLEILTCLGNFSRKDGLPKAHLHVTLSRHDGSTLGGHLMPGSTVFACEAVIEELVGPGLNRGYDPQTGLPLWEKK